MFAIRSLWTPAEEPPAKPLDQLPTGHVRERIWAIKGLTSREKRMLLTAYEEWRKEVL